MSHLKAVAEGFLICVGLFGLAVMYAGVMFVATGIAVHFIVKFW